MALPFLPISRAETDALGWREVDVVLISGDAYVDHPAFGAAVIGRVLEAEGLRVAVIAQPDWRSPDAVKVFGKPRLFFGVTSGNVDSMLARFTAFKKVRNDDPYTPGGEAGRRPERAVIVYCNMVRAAYKDVPLVIGGIEASMRRLAHYDFWDDRVRRSILLDSRADLLVYGMGEKAIIEAARRLKSHEPLSGIPGTVEARKDVPGDAKMLPPEEDAIADRAVYARFYREFYFNQYKTLAQPSAKRFLAHYPAAPCDSDDLDRVYALPFARAPHPSYELPVPAFEMIRASVVSHRGCVSGCAFCSLALHQGRRIVSRSADSVMEEVRVIAGGDGFHGHITDIGGPSANMYGFTCAASWRCARASCVHPDLCPKLNLSAGKWMALLKKARGMKGVKHVTVGSGIRYDIFMRDDPSLLEELVANHVSGQLKIAPEHTSAGVLKAMHKSPLYDLREFVSRFLYTGRRRGKEQYIIPYLMSCHPGCGMSEMRAMREDAADIFGFLPEQVQAFIPLPLTPSSAMYWTGTDPLTGEDLFVERDPKKRRAQHDMMLKK